MDICGPFIWKDNLNLLPLKALHLGGWGLVRVLEIRRMLASVNSDVVACPICLLAFWGGLVSGLVVRRSSQTRFSD